MCRLNEVAYATHPAHAVVNFVQHLGGVVSQGDGIHWLFMLCAPTFIPHDMETISTTEQHNHSSGMHKQFWNALKIPEYMNVRF